MVVKIRFGRGPVVTGRKGKNGRAALLVAALLTLTSVCVASLGIWRLCEDLNLAGRFFFHEGLLSHWQVWIGAAVLTQYARWRLTRYATGAQEFELSEVSAEAESNCKESGCERLILRPFVILMLDSAATSMRYDTRYRTRVSFFGGSLPQGVKWLILANLAVYLVYYFGSLATEAPIFRSFVLVPYDVVHRFMIWQLVTYMFLHSLQSFFHILFNMLALWMFGTPVEQTWGTRRFLQYYFLCGIGGGICVVVANFLFGNPHTGTLGASGAIYGLLLAFGMLFPNQEVLVSFLFPIKAKYMVMIYGGIAFLSSFQSGSGVSSVAHLGGMLFGFFYIRSQFTRKRVAAGSGFRLDLSRRLREYKLQRAKKKFQVYMKKHGSGPLQ